MPEYQLILWDEAEGELFDAASWYDVQRHGLGEELLATVRDCLREVAMQPTRFPLVLDDFRRALVARFPYSVIFRIRRDRIEVLAIIHQSRDPKRWMQRDMEKR